MDDPNRGLPYHLRNYVLALLALVLTFYGLIMAEPVLAPLALAFLLALLLLPLARWLERLGVPRGLAAILSIVVILIALGAIVTFISLQVSSISEDLPDIQEELESALGGVSAWVESRFGIGRQRQEEYLSGVLSNAARSGTEFLSSLVSATTGVFTFLIIMPIALFFFLYYRGFFKEFLFRAFGGDRRAGLEEAITEVQEVGLHYIVGLFLVILILAALNTVGLLLFGIGHPLFWGVFSSLLSVIPYIGAFIGAIFPILFAVLTTDSLLIPLGLAGWFIVVQQVEGDLIMPNVMGSRVSINPFAAIIALVVGGEIWGVAGLVLAIPYLAILKVLFDAIGPLRPYGYLLGTPPAGRRTGRVKRMLRGLWKKIRGTGK